ncbi:MAG: PilZ domain-containing protein [Magnetococcus sp. YQC-9]
MENQPIKDPNDLYEALLGLLVRAREGDLPADLIQILFHAVEKVTASSRKESVAPSSPVESNNRQHFRLVANARGTMIIAGERTPVVIQDVSPQGFGVRSTSPVRPNTTLLLEVPASAGGMDIFSCFVSYSKRDEKAFVVGLRVVDMLPRF